MLKALALFSGGLDSMLVVKVLQAQGIDVDGVCFVSNFFGCEKAKIAADSIGLNLKIVDISEDILDIVKNPPNGYGKNLNPCIDCHVLMVKKAGAIAQTEDYDFVATGEVLGQRPFSQNVDALKRVEKLAGIEVLRPLSAKLLDETEFEKNGLVNRGRLLNISGRSRDRQMELAEKYDLKDYATPAGGCLLTDPEFSQRLMKLMDYWPKFTQNDIELLKNGRVFWLTLKSNKKVLTVIGRNYEENERIKTLAQKDDVIMEIEKIMGPTTLVRISNFHFSIFNEIIKVNVPEVLKIAELKLGEAKGEKETLDMVGLLTGYYATKARGKEIQLRIMNDE